MTPRAALLVALFSQSPVGAAPESAPTRLHLDVRASAECSSRADLSARISARSPRIEVADDGTVVAQVVITTPRAGSAVADIILGADQTPRRVVARSCAEAADGAALIIAVTLDPNLRRRPSSTHAEGRRVAGEAAPPPVALLPAAVPPPPPPPTPVPVAVAPSPQQPPTQERASRHELGAAVGGQTLLGAAPALLPGVALYAMAGLDRHGLWEPALLLGLSHVWRSDLAETGGSASFALDAVSLDACPLALRWSRLAARPCLSGLIGRLASQGDDNPQTGAARPFGSVGVALSATWGWRWQLFARLGLGATLLRDSYEFASVFYKAAPVTFSATLGVGAGWR